MFMNYFSYKVIVNFFMLFLLIMFSFMTISINNNFIKWIFMEMFTLSFITLINMNNLNKIPSLIYFSISSISSLILFFNLMISINYWNMNFNMFLTNNIYMYIIQLNLIMKIGIFPFHLWIFHSFLNLNWQSIFIFSTLTKIIPIYMISSMTNFNFLIYLILISNSLIMSFYMINETNIKKIFAMSSINHSSYLLFFSFLNNFMSLFYLFFYSFNLLLLTYFLDKLNIKNKFNIINLNSLKMLNNFFIIAMLSYNMLPPLSTFIYKWMFFYELIYINNSMIFIYLLSLSSILNCWILMNICNYKLLNKKMFKKNFMKISNINMPIYLIIFISIFMNSMMLFYMFIN